MNSTAGGGMTKEVNNDSAQAGAGRFASTQWSVVLQAGAAPHAPEVHEALARLCSTYWYPLYVFIRRQGHSAEDAEDLTQEFFARFLEKNFLSTVERNRGKFRTFLLACCQHFLANQREFARAQKRGGGRPALPLDFPGATERYRVEPNSTENAEKLFERRWALTVLDQVLQQLQWEYQNDGKSALFDHLKNVLVSATEALSYAQIGLDLSMNEEAVRKAAQRLRQRYRCLLRERIADTVDAPERVDDEIRELFAALAS
jgi:DNA-directed RNA polymerase specialized sigma24 family protein